MADISKIDKNFEVTTGLEIEDVCYVDIKQHTEFLYGLTADTQFRRMPLDVAHTINDGIAALHTNTAGGRIRFVTDSPYIALCAVLPDKVVFPHMPQTGVAGFDLYDNKQYVQTFMPPAEYTGKVEGVYHFYDVKKREILIHFPLYTNVQDVYIGIKQGSMIRPADPYPVRNNVVFYGSSITQGACVTRPGLSYASILSNWLGFDFVNLGFSGSARGEQKMAEYIASLNPRVLVMDYDHNAPTTEFLEKTHNSFFRIFREAHKDTPVIFLSAPNLRFHPEGWSPRRRVIQNTYEKALCAGDTNVYFIDGEKLWGEKGWDLCTGDVTHPNDLGHYRMAEMIRPMLEKIIK